MIEDDVIARARYLHLENPNRNKHDIAMQAVNELENDVHLRQIYSIFDIDYNTYINDISEIIWKKTY